MLDGKAEVAIQAVSNGDCVMTAHKHTSNKQAGHRAGKLGEDEWKGMQKTACVLLESNLNVIGPKSELVPLESLMQVL